MKIYFVILKKKKFNMVLDFLLCGIIKIIKLNTKIVVCSTVFVWSITNFVVCLLIFVWSMTNFVKQHGNYYSAR